MNFRIENNGIVSARFIEQKITDFNSACQFVASLSYRRNSDKNDLLCLFNDNGGTCSTKHATLRKLAIENNRQDVKLILGIFKMDSEYSHLIRETLDSNQLSYIPEAHNYLLIGDTYFDFTSTVASYSKFQEIILIEKEIEYDQITDFKIAYHKAYLEKWIIDEGSKFTLNEVWEIREKCISDLQGTTRLKSKK